MLPGTGGLTRLVDKRHVRRDLADVFATRAEGVKGEQARRVGPRRRHRAPRTFAELVAERARRPRPDASDRPTASAGHRRSPPLDRDRRRRRDRATPRRVTLDRDVGAAPRHRRRARPELSRRPATSCRRRRRALDLAAARQLDDAILHLRFNEPELGTWVLRTVGDPDAVAAPRSPVLQRRDHWLVAGGPPVLGAHAEAPRRVVAHAGRRSSSPAVASPGRWPSWRSPPTGRTCSTGTCDDDDTTRSRRSGSRAANDGWYPMANGLSRLATRFWGHDERLGAARDLIGKDLLAAEAVAAGLVTFAPTTSTGRTRCG